jgi:bla regulator protein blaR1
MTVTWITSAILSWTLQASLLAAAGMLVSLTLAHPKTRLIFWQGLLVLMLLLPAAEPWRAAPSPGATIDTALRLTSGAAATRFLVSPRTVALWLIAAGAVLRLAWIAVGFTRLRAYRHSARPIAPPEFARGTARWYLSELLPGPVTYGWRKPVILLPSRMPDTVFESIALHELVHVRRRDWLCVVAEELVRALLWFQPAVWVALSRIQIAREEVVDREVVGITRDRDGYVDALVTIAGQSVLPDLAPAPLFLKKRHLRSRVAGLLKEITMSPKRIAATLAAAVPATILAAAGAVWLFPIASPAQDPPKREAPPQPSRRAEPQNENGESRPPSVISRIEPAYPQEAKDEKVQGKVILHTTIDETGKATNFEVVDTPGAGLEQAAIDAVSQWAFRPGTKDGRPVSVQVTIEVNFQLK